MSSFSQGLTPTRRFTETLATGLTMVAVCMTCQRLAGADAESGQGSSSSVLAKVERKIVKEPKYESKPRYALLVLGACAENQVWLVEDGKKLYVDANANSDLTDDGLALEATNYRSLGRLDGDSDRWDFDYLLDEIAPAKGTLHTDLRLARWNYGGEQKEDQYGLSIKLNGKTPMYAGWFGTFWADSPDDVPLLHFGGPLKPRLMREKEFVIGSGPRRLSVALMNSDNGDGATTRLSIDALAAEVTPVVQIDWPIAQGATPVRTTTRLTERCCYWEFYDSKFQVPAGVVAGTAKIKLSLDGGEFPLKLTTDRWEAPVVTEASGPGN